MFPFGESWPFSLVPALLIAVPTSIVILVYAYLKLRPKLPVRVHCWFCRKNSDVPYDNRNCWDCPHCEQYNGFSSDGGYNKVIPAQHDELLNHAVTAKSSVDKKSPLTFKKSPFCRKCTINQDLKIQQLASFTPRDNAYFDEEVEEYRQHLERAYQLCESCELIVKQTLHQQQGWLLGQHRKHLLSHRSQPTQRLVAWWHRGLPVIWMQRTQIASTVVALGLLLSHNHESLANSFSQYISPDIAYLLEVAPIYDHVVTSILTIAVVLITGCSAFRRRVDIITAVLWFVLLVHKWLLLWPYLKSHVSEEDLKMGHVIVIGLTFFVNAVAAVTSRQVCPSKQLMVKRLKQNFDRVCRGRDITEHFNSPVAVAGEHSSDKSSSACLSDTSHISIPSPSVDNVERDQYSSVQSINSERLITTFPPEELEWGLGKLSLGPCSVRNKNSTVFKTKPYNSNSGLGFFQTARHQTANVEHHSGKHSPLLRPPKLNIRRNVTQTSWVAGGYWRELGGTLSKAVKSGRNLLDTSPHSQNFSPVSRTSSQSSGFHSRSSNSPASSPNSYSGSLCGGDIDHFSVLSEPATPMLSCQCVSSRPNAAYASKFPFMGMPYYMGFPMCVPHLYPLSVAPTSGVIPRSMPWMANPQFFSAYKQCLTSNCCLSSFQPTPAKQLLHSPTVASDALSHSGSSFHSNNHVVPEQMKKDMQNIWRIMKQNVVLSVLCIGSLLFNIVGMGMLIYQNRFVFQMQNYFS